MSKSIKLTDREIEVLKALKTLGLYWIARNEYGWLRSYNYERYFYIEGNIFNFIKWEDEEPKNIDDLLKELENE